MDQDFSHDLHYVTIVVVGGIVGSRFKQADMAAFG